MPLSVGELKKVSVQSIRDIATGLHAKATSMRATQAGVTDLPHKGTWTGVAADNADHEIGHFAKGVGRDADAYEDAAKKADRAGDEFEGIKQLLAKLENEASGKFSINEATGEVTPLSKDFNKSDRDYIANTIKQLCAAGGQANEDLAGAIHATDASGATSPASAAGGPLAAMPGSAIKPDGVVGGLQNLAAPNPDGDPGATKAAAAVGGDTQANYKEWYPKSTAPTADKVAIDPSKAGSFSGTVGALQKLPGTPKPPDGWGTGVARQFGQGVNNAIDGMIDEAKSKVGLNGADKFKDAWIGTAKNLEHEVVRQLNPGFGMAEDAKSAIDQAVTAYQHPEVIPKNIGGALAEGSAVAVTGPLAGEAAAGARGLLGDATIAGRGGLLDMPGLPHDTPPVPGHASVEPPSVHPGPVADHPAPTVDHPAPTADHGPAVVDHPAPVTDHAPPPVPHQPPAPVQFDPTGGQHYASGDPHHPGGWPPGTPEPTWSKGDSEPGWKHINHNVDKDWMPYQQQIGGLERTPAGALPEWVQPNPETGAPVDFDGHTHRGPQEVFLEAKDGYRGMAFAPDNSYWQGRADKAIIQVQRQLAALPPGSILEWHVSDPYGASALRQLFADRLIYDVDVIYTPKAP